MISMNLIIILMNQLCAYLLILASLVSSSESVLFRQRPPGNEDQLGGEFGNHYLSLEGSRYRNDESNLILQKRYCLSYDPIQGVCKKCISGLVFSDTQKKCIQNPTQNPQKTTTLTQGSGISTNSSLDLLASMSSGNNFFCQTVVGQVCEKCFKGFILKANRCIEDQSSFSPTQVDFMKFPLNPLYSLCESFDANGKCKSCLADSILTSDDCVLPNRTDSDCNFHQFCNPIVEFCETYGSDLNCKTCPKGAINIHGVCRKAEKKDLCIKYNEWKMCQQCIYQTSLTNYQTCSYITPNCARFDNSRTCIQCKPLFLLKNGDCILVANIPFLKKDINCYTWKQGICIKCKFGYDFKIGLCSLVENYDPIRH